MRCFKCNEVLTKESHCPNCGIDVSLCGLGNSITRLGSTGFLKTEAIF